MDLVAEEGVLNEGGWVVVEDHLDDAPHHLPDLVVDEALPHDVEYQVVLVQLLDRKGYYKAVRLGIFGFEVLGVVVEVVWTDELLAAGTDLLQHQDLFFWIMLALSTHIFDRLLHLDLLLSGIYFTLLVALLIPKALDVLRIHWQGWRLFFAEQFFGADVAVVSAPDDVAHFWAIGESPETMVDDIGALEALLEVEVQMVAVEDVVIVEVILVDGEQAWDAVKDGVHSFVRAGGAWPFVLLFEYAVVGGGEEPAGVQSFGHEIFDGADVVLELELHAAEVEAVVADEQR
jgi:hypothetical protein